MSGTNVTTVAIEDMLPGDEYWLAGTMRWRIIGKRDEVERGVAYDIEWADGGRDVRVWDEGLMIAVWRPEALAPEAESD